LGTVLVEIVTAPAVELAVDDAGDVELDVAVAELEVVAVDELAGAAALVELELLEGELELLELELELPQPAIASATMTGRVRTASNLRIKTSFGLDIGTTRPWLARA
jgi:hypothetical protein